MPVLDAQIRNYVQRISDHEKRIQELEKELDLGSEPSEFGNKLQRRRNLEYLRDVPLDRDEQKQWEAGL